MVAFMIKASVATLKAFPIFNASLDGEDLILKQYYNIGFAADTPTDSGARDRTPTKRACLEIAREMRELSPRRATASSNPARCKAPRSRFSLGGIGGTSFTPIINAPEVAIIGVSRSAMKPVWNGKRVRPAPDAAAVAVLGPSGDRRRRRGAIQRPPGQGPERSEASAAVTESPRSGHRGLHRRSRDRDPRLARRRGRGRGSAGHARVRQGDDGRAGARGRDRQLSCGSRSATACPRAACC